MIGAFVGGIFGAVIGTAIFPVIGSLIGSFVGAGAVVAADLPDFAVAAGVPARVVRSRS